MVDYIAVTIPAHVQGHFGQCGRVFLWGYPFWGCCLLRNQRKTQTHLSDPLYAEAEHKSDGPFRGLALYMCFVVCLCGACFTSVASGECKGRIAKADTLPEGCAASSKILPLCVCNYSDIAFHCLTTSWVAGNQAHVPNVSSTELSRTFREIDGSVGPLGDFTTALLASVELVACSNTFLVLIVSPCVSMRTN